MCAEERCWTMREKDAEAESGRKQEEGRFKQEVDEHIGKRKLRLALEGSKRREDHRKS